MVVFVKKLAVLLVAFSLIFSNAAFAEQVVDSGNLIIHFLDVGQADAVILQCGDEVLMIDGGNSANSSFIYSYLTETLGISRIDYMIATHPHEDHIGGLSGALNACSIGCVYSPVTSYDSETFSSLLKYTQAQGLELTAPDVGDTFTFGDAQVQFLSPVRQYSSINDYSIVVRIIHGSNTFLFAGDAELDAEHDMVSSGYNLSSTVLKVGHHGGDCSSSYVFLREVMPAYAVISCGKWNLYDHPSDNTLSRLRDVGATIFRTDLQGTVICISDGKTLTFSIEKSVTYIGNKRTKKFHYPSCPSVNDINKSNQVELNSREEAIEHGYVPCKRCEP